MKCSDGEMKGTAMSNNHDLGRDDEMNPMETDELDVLLRRWHEVNAQRAATGRAQLLMKLEQTRSTHPLAPSLQGKGDRPKDIHPHPMKRYLRAAASFALLIMLAALLIPLSHSPVQAQQIMVPDGGRLDAIDRQGRIIGPCALQHTDVNIAISGPFTRVTVKQQYHNPYQSKIEAVYTFPLSHRGAVDRMSMTIGDRVIQAEMKERQQARQIYESARQAGNVASLLEQERPNIFTQSVANIEPNADVQIEISYVEMLQSKDGQYTFDFPMTVAPRYIPGYSQPGTGGGVEGGGNWQHADAVRLPNELERRWGVILLGPATFQRVQFSVQTGSPTDGQPARVTSTQLGPAPLVQHILDAAVPILAPGPEYRARPEIQTLLRSRPEGGIDFYAHYSDGRSDFGQIAADGLGQVAGRWFYFDPALLDRIDPNWRNTKHGIGYEPDTNQVPDASRITPAPVRPPMRAGHDISLKVSIDTGGPGIVDYKSDLHEIICTDEPKWRNLGDKINLALTNKSEIPNRDFVLHWRTANDAVKESTFTYMPPKAVDDKGGFFTLMLAPPARVDEAAIAPRELIFVLDTSGSMSGLPIEKAKDLMVKAIQAMRSRDTFNIITFSGDTHILWDKPRSNTDANRNEALAFLTSRAGSGGTEMMTAINAALAPTNAVEQPLTPEQLSNLPADGRDVFLRAQFGAIEAMVMKNAVMQPKLRVREGLAIALSSFQLPVEEIMRDPQVLIRGKWTTVNGERILHVASAQAEPPIGIGPLRIVVFLTDGQVGNDNAIIQAVKDNAKTTRVFGFGVGDAPNRYLLDGMAQAGRGEVEYVNLQSNPDAAVQRFARRIGTPVLTDIKLAFSGQGVEITDTIPPLDAVPDLFDLKPLIIHGRYKTGGTGVSPVKAKLAIHGTTGAGPYERTLDLTLPAATGAGAVNGGAGDDHSVIATLWARAKVQEIMKTDLNAVQQNTPTQQMHDQIVALGEQFSIMTQYTSFVAVEKARITIGGQAMLVPVPIEFPEGEQWEGTFGNEGKPGADHNLFRLSDFFNVDGTLKGPVIASTFEPRSSGKQFGWKASVSQFASKPDRTIPGRNITNGASPSGAIMPGNLAGPGPKSISGVSADVGGFPWQSERQRDDQNTEGAKAAEAGNWNVGLYDNIDRVGAYVMIDGLAEAAPGNGPGIGRVFPSRDNDGFMSHSLSIESNFYRPDEAQVMDRQAGVATAMPVNPPGDTNGNGVVSVDDLLDVVNHYGPCPSGIPGSGGGGMPNVSSGGTAGFVELPRSSALLASPSAESSEKSRQFNMERSERTTNSRPMVDASFHRIGSLVAQDKRAEVLEVINEILFMDEHNSVAVALRGALQSDDAATTSNLLAFEQLAATHVPIDFTGKVADIIDLFSKTFALNVKLDWDALAAIGINKEAPIALTATDITAAAALEQTIDQLGHAEKHALYFLRAGTIIISTADAIHDSSLSRVYNIRDLIEAPATVPVATSVSLATPEQLIQQVIDIIQENVDPDSWRSLGGHTGDIQQCANTLLITNTPIHHKEIAGLLVELREIRTGKTPELTDVERTEREAQIAESKRKARLHRIIDQRLWPLAFAPSDEDRNAAPPDTALNKSAADAAAAGPVDETTAHIFSSALTEPIAIAVLVRNTNGETIVALTSAGIKIEDIAKSLNVVAGTIAPQKLTDLAMLECARKIEPVNE